MVGVGYLFLVLLFALASVVAGIRDRLRDPRTAPGMSREQVWEYLEDQRRHRERMEAHRRKRDQQEIDRLIESTKSK